MNMRDASNALRSVTALKMRDSGNVLRSVKSIKMRDAGNVLRTVFTSMTAAAAPSAVSGVRGTGVGIIYTDYTYVTVAGGTGPFTYAWATVESGWTISNPTAAVTRFSAAPGAGDSMFADFACTVTDAAGATATAGVSASVENVNNSTA